MLCQEIRNEPFVCCGDGEPLRRLWISRRECPNAIIVLNPQRFCLLTIQRRVKPTLFQKKCDRFVAVHPPKQRNSTKRCRRHIDTSTRQLYLSVEQSSSGTF